MASDQSGYVYLMKSETTGLYKIGLSIDPDRRRLQLQTDLKEPVILIHSIKTNDMKELEALLHIEFRNKWHHNEWFMLSGADAEQLKTVTDDYIKSPWPLSMTPPPIRTDIEIVCLSNGKFCRMVKHKLSGKKAFISSPVKRRASNDIKNTVIILGIRPDVKPSVLDAFIVESISGKTFTMSRVRLDVQR